jgi:large subunit ribosomal protein L14
MIQIKSLVVVADNTGPKIVHCFGPIGYSKKKYAYVGYVITGSVRKVGKESTVKEGEKVVGLVIRTKFPIRREDGSYVRFDDNAIVLIDKDGNPKGTRIFGPVPRELKEKYLKVISLATEVV